MIGNFMLSRILECYRACRRQRGERNRRRARERRKNIKYDDYRQAISHLGLFFEVLRGSSPMKFVIANI